jgi:aminoglycoside 2'-N-acetyltransferase I
MRAVQAAIVDYDLAGLSTGSPGFYTRLGWQSWRGPLFVRTEVGPLTTPTDSVMILLLPHTPPLDLDGPLSAEWRVGELW